nr:hypothetical protein [candidate division Zixibacteria bacterium]
MKRILPLLILTVFAGIAIIGIIPGCDELITNEYYDTIADTVTLMDSSCVKMCHSDFNTDMEAALRQWHNSPHALAVLTDDTAMGLEAADCGARCHSHEGFVKSLSNISGSVDFPTPINCFTCHKPHTQPYDFSLRDSSEITLADGSSIYNLNQSNICARCHQSLVDKLSSITNNMLIGETWDSLVYHGWADAEMIIGTGGYEYNIVTYEHSGHDAAVNGCVTCHQEKAEGFMLGGHSLNIRDMSNPDIILLEACNGTGCHATAPLSTDTINALQAYVLSKLDTLEQQLLDDDMLLILGDIVIPNPDMIFQTADSAGALYNYFYIKNDRSSGMHDFVYDTLLLESSIKYLRGDYTP